MAVAKIQHGDKQPFRRFHYNICNIGGKRGTNELGNRITVSIIKMTYHAMNARSTFRNELLKSVSNTQLTVDHNFGTVSNSQPCGLDYPVMSLFGGGA